MLQTSVVNKQFSRIKSAIRDQWLWRCLFAGILVPCGFAPIHLPGLAILGMALLFAQLQQQPRKQAFINGFIFGLGFLGVGVSWIYVSVHEYGHLNALVSAIITLFFVFYLAIYPGLVALLYSQLSIKRSMLLQCFLFSALWCLGEYARSTFLSGFPWLLLGYAQIDTPLKHLLPIIGVYGTGFFACLSATFLVASVFSKRPLKYLYLMAFIAILLAPGLLHKIEWTTVNPTPISVAVVQPNLSIRDQWDEHLFWQLLQQYDDAFNQLIGKKQLIVLPESAIPLPASYIHDFMDNIHQRAKEMGTSILLGIPMPTTADDNAYYNTLTALGRAKGFYFKQHLVPFGEFIPQSFRVLTEWLSIPAANMKPGKSNQKLIHSNHYPIASLICYELAYPQLLRQQMPQAQWIVSISDDGWFGHSLAMYQQLQMAQVLSMLTGRFQVVANKEGLSSIIDEHGQLLHTLPAFTAGVLEATLYPATGATPWVRWGDGWLLLLCLCLVILAGITSARRHITNRKIIKQV